MCVPDPALLAAMIAERRVGTHTGNAIRLFGAASAIGEVVNRVDVRLRVKGH